MDIIRESISSNITKINSSTPSYFPSVHKSTKKISQYISLSGQILPLAHDIPMVLPLIPDMVDALKVAGLAPSRKQSTTFAVMSSHRTSATLVISERNISFALSKHQHLIKSVDIDSNGEYETKPQHHHLHNPSHNIITEESASFDSTFK